MERAINQNFVKEFLLRLASTVTASKEYLDKLDAACGDGDFGVGMYVGFKKVEEVIRQSEEKDIGSLLSAAGYAILSSVGGASGPLFAALFIEAGKATRGKSEINLEDIAGAFESSFEKVCQRGGAEVGDKTLIDALSPAVRALREAARGGFGVKKALLAAAEAAGEGSESTRDMVAKKGKAKYLGRQTLGEIDPGAEVVRIIFETLCLTESLD